MGSAAHNLIHVMKWDLHKMQYIIHGRDLFSQARRSAIGIKDSLWKALINRHIYTSAVKQNWIMHFCFQIPLLRKKRKAIYSKAAFQLYKLSIWVFKIIVKEPVVTFLFFFSFVFIFNLTGLYLMQKKIMAKIGSNDHRSK